MSIRDNIIQRVGGSGGGNVPEGSRSLPSHTTIADNLAKRLNLRRQRDEDEKRKRQQAAQKEFESFAYENVPVKDNRRPSGPDPFAQLRGTDPSQKMIEDIFPGFKKAQQEDTAPRATDYDKDGNGVPDSIQKPERRETKLVEQIKPEEITQLQEAIIAGDVDTVKKIGQDLYGRANPSNFQKVRNFGKEVGKGIISVPEKVGDSVQAITGWNDLEDVSNRITQEGAARRKEITARFDRGEITESEMNSLKVADLQRQSAELGAASQDTEWAGTDGNRLRIAAGVGLEGAFDVGLALTTGGTGNAVKAGATGGVKATAKAIAKQGVATGVQAAGSAFGESLQGQDFTAEEALKKTGTGLVAGTALGVAIPTAAKGDSKIAKAGLETDIIKPVAAQTNDLTSRLTSKASTSKVGKATVRFREQWLDRNARLHDYVKELENATGKKYKGLDSPSDTAKLVSGSGGAAEKKLAELDTVWKSVGERKFQNEIAEYGVARRLLSDGPKVRTKAQLAEAQKSMDKLVAKYGEDVLNEGFQKVNDYSNSLLDLFVDEDIITKEVAENLKKNTDYFAKLEIMQRELDNPGTLASGMSVADQKLIRTQKGFSDDAQILDPRIAQTNQTLLAYQTIFKNRVGKALGKIADNEDASDLIRKVRSTGDVQTREAVRKFLSETKEVKVGIEKSIKKNNTAAKSLQRKIKSWRAALDGKKKSVVAARLEKELKSDPDALSAVKQFMREADGASINDIYESMLELKTTPYWEGLRKTISSNDKSLSRILDDVDNLGKQLEDINSQRYSAWQYGKQFSDKQVPRGYDVIHYQEAGIKNSVAVPQEVADVMKGLNRNQIDLVSGFMAKSGRFFRNTVTTFRPVFVFFRNPTRDFKNFVTNSNKVPVRKAVSRWVQGFYESLTGKGYADEFAEAGASQSGFIYSTSGVKNATKLAKGIGKESNIAAKAIKKPFDIYMKLGEAIENAPRLAEFKAQREAGESAARAAVAAREITVDFAQAGKAGQLANMWVPFVNAKIQGTRRLARAFKENPARAMTVYATTTALPAAATIYHNVQNHKDVWDDIPDWEKENNFIIILSDRKNDEGRYEDIIKIPKGELDLVLGNPIEQMVLSQLDANPNSFAGTVLEALSNASPVEFESDGKFSPTRLAGGLTPPIGKAVLEPAFNRDLFFDSPVVPENMRGLPPEEQVYDSTSTFARLAGKLGISPLVAENVLKNLAGPSARNLSSPERFIDDFERSAGSAQGDAIKTEFFDKYFQMKDVVYAKNKKITEAVQSGDINRAKRMAEELNNQIEDAFDPFFARNAQNILGGDYDYNDIIDNLKVSEDYRYLRNRGK